MTVISKGAGVLSLISCITDMHKSGVIQANNTGAKEGADSFLRQSISAQKTNYVSAKDAKRKEWVRQNSVLPSVNDTLGRIKGYFRGFVAAGARYLPNIGLSTIALASKNKTIAGMSTVALALVHTWDFIKNSTKILEKTDYLE